MSFDMEVVKENINRFEKEFGACIYEVNDLEDKKQDLTDKKGEIQNMEKQINAIKKNKSLSEKKRNNSINDLQNSKEKAQEEAKSIEKEIQIMKRSIKTSHRDLIQIAKKIKQTVQASKDAKIIKNFSKHIKNILSNDYSTIQAGIDALQTIFKSVQEISLSNIADILTFARQYCKTTQELLASLDTISFEKASDHQTMLIAKYDGHQVKFGKKVDKSEFMTQIWNSWRDIYIRLNDLKKSLENIKRGNVTGMESLDILKGKVEDAKTKSKTLSEAAQVSLSKIISYKPGIFAKDKKARLAMKSKLEEICRYSIELAKNIDSQFGKS